MANGAAVARCLDDSKGIALASPAKWAMMTKKERTDLQSLKPHEGLNLSFL